MKKVVILMSILFLPVAVQAFPAPDMTEGGSPFLIMQQHAFEKNELNDFKRFEDANDRPVSMRTDSAKQMKEEYKIQEMKKNPKFQLQSLTEQTQDVPEPQKMKLIEQDGHIMIKQIGY